jgi:hypothetical protein
MEELHISMVAILVAVVANFFVGFLWYTPLFGKAWAKEMGIDMTVKPPGSVMARGMIMMVIGTFFQAYVFAHNIGAWTYVPGTSTMSPIESILMASVFTWLGFYMPVDLNRVAWEKASWKLFAINTGYHFVSVLVAATILTYMMA